jgi:hypothetical protein
MCLLYFVALLPCGCYVVDLKCNGQTPVAGSAFRRINPVNCLRLHLWMQDAIWKPVSGKLCQSAAYQQLSWANYAFEYDNDG